MQFQLTRIVFFTLLIADLIVLKTHSIDFRLFTKGLIVPSLLIYCIIYQRKFPFLIIGLLFTWFGDLSLIFEGELFFILGLGSFLIGHIFYILQINRFPKKNLNTQYGLIILLGGIAVSYLYFIQPFAAALFLPVVLYVLTISLMVLSAFRQTKSTHLKIGALFFLCSDSILGLKTFGAFDFSYSEIVVMATYGIAQYLIVYGIIQKDKAPL